VYVTPEECKSDVAELNQTLQVSTSSSKGARLNESVEEKTESETDWSEIVARRHKRYTKASKVVTQPTPDIVNRNAYIHTHISFHRSTICP